MAGRNRWRMSGHKTKRVIVRSIYEHVQGTTVRFVEPKALPTGCCHLITAGGSQTPYTCTMAMTHVEMKVEWRFVPESKSEAPVVKLVGYCKTHRPKKTEGAMVHLPTDIIRAVNGTTNVRAKIKRMASAMYVDVAVPGSSKVHSMPRSQFKANAVGDNWMAGAVALCKRSLKEAVLVTDADRKAEDGWTECKICAGEKEAVADADV